MASNSPATRESALPALAPTPALDIGSEDVALPRIKIGQPSSRHVEDELVPKGCLYSSTSKDDGDPAVLYKHGEDKGLRFHVLGMHKAKSITVEGELQTFAFNDPDAPADCWTTYNYVVCAPDHDTDVPYKWLLTRSGKTAAQQVNMRLKKNEAKGPAYLTAFEATTVPRSNDKGHKWFVPSIRVVEATEEGVAAAARLAEMIAGTAMEQTASSSGGSEPAI